MTTSPVASAKQTINLATQIRVSISVGMLAALILIGLAVLILAQLLLFPSNAPQSLWEIFSDKPIAKTLVFSLFQAGLSTIISLVLGILLAWSLANSPKFPFRNILIALISSALVLPTLVVVLGIVSVYGRAGWLADLGFTWFGAKLPFSIYGLGGILLAHTFFNASFAARLLLHRFESIAIEKHKLAYSLGMGFVRKTMIVELPAIRPAIPGLALTIFLLCFTSFAIVLTLGGHPAYNTLEVAIYEAVKFDFDLQRAFQLAMVQIAVCLVLVFLTNAKPVVTSPASVAFGTRDLQHLMSRNMRSLQYAMIFVFSVFFLSPLVAIVLGGLDTAALEILGGSLFLNALKTSIAIAMLAACLALLISLVLSSAMVSLSSKMRNPRQRAIRLLGPVLSVSAMLYLVFPALVMGLGFFLMFQKTGGDPALWAAAVVTIANALMAIPFGVAILLPAINAAANANDRLCNSLGLGFWRRMHLVNFPVLKNDIFYVLALAFCLSLGDLGVIALFGSNELQTLPWLLYQKFGSYRTNDAGVIALFLLLLITTVFFAAQKFSNREYVR